MKKSKDKERPQNDFKRKQTNRHSRVLLPMVLPACPGRLCLCKKSHERPSGKQDSDFPEVVDCIVFWTKNAAPMLDQLDLLEDYDYYFQFTVNDYGREVEPYVPEHSRRLETFMRLSKKSAGIG